MNRGEGARGSSSFRDCQISFDEKERNKLRVRAGKIDAYVSMLCWNIW